MSRIERRALRAFCVAVEAAVPAAISQSSQATRLPLQLTCRANIRVSILLPKTSQIILDNVVVLDKGSAGVNAPLPLHGKITISYSVSVTHTQP